ncbi:MAG: hypothetical protein ACRENB_06170 [Gemmatimonadales bacterium]
MLDLIRYAPLIGAGGPALSTLITVTCVVALVLAPWFARLHH